VGIGRRSLLIAAGVAVLAGVWIQRTRPPQAARPTAGENIIAFGDSLVSGRGATPGHDFVSVLSRRTGLAILNAGRSGDTTQSALERLDRDVLAWSPRIVIVLLGGNDYLRRVPRDETFRNLETIVMRIRRQGAAVVLAGVDVGLFADQYGERYEALARRASAGLVPDVLDGIVGHADRTSDAIHPNDRGYEMIADRLEPVLRDLVDHVD
jgi:lysophospholipase L1-like esterase